MLDGVDVEGLEERVGVGEGAIEGERVGDEVGLIVRGTVGEDVGAEVGLTVGAGEGANVGVRFCAINSNKRRIWKYS